MCTFVDINAYNWQDQSNGGRLTASCGFLVPKKAWSRNCREQFVRKREEDVFHNDDKDVSNDDGYLKKT